MRPYEISRQTPGGETIEELFTALESPLLAYALRYTGTRELAEDIVQEAFIAATRHIGNLRDDSKFGSWLFGIAHQKCIQRWRKQDRESAALEEISAEPESFENDPGELLVRREQEEAFMKLLNQLAPAHRSVLLLHFLEDFSLEEIARITGSTLGTVKSRMHYAKKSLRKLMETQ